MQIKNASTAYPLCFLMIDSADHISGKTGLTPTVTLSKAGGSFASPAGSVSEIANGWYKVAGNATDTDTLGVLILHAESTGADPVDLVSEVVASDPQDAVRLGLSALPNASAAASGGLITVGNSSGQLDVSSGKVLLQATQTGVTIPTVTDVTNPVSGTVVSSGLTEQEHNRLLSLSSVVPA